MDMQHGSVFLVYFDFKLTIFCKATADVTRLDAGPSSSAPFMYLIAHSHTDDVHVLYNRSEPFFKAVKFRSP